MCPSLCPYIFMQCMHMKLPQNNRMLCYCSASCINTDAALKVSYGCSQHRQLLHVPRCTLHDARLAASAYAKHSQIFDNCFAFMHLCSTLILLNVAANASL